MNDLTSSEIELKFFVHVVRYQPNIESFLPVLNAGDSLKLSPEPENVFDSDAIRVEASSKPVGYHLNALAPLFARAEIQEVTVSQVNSAVAATCLRLLVPAIGRDKTGFKWPWSESPHLVFPTA